MPVIKAVALIHASIPTGCSTFSNLTRPHPTGVESRSATIAKGIGAVNSSLLVDVGPAVGGHGQRGIGRYVRGLVTSIASFPEDLADRIWALGFAGPTLDSFGARAVQFAAHRGMGRVPTWVTGRFDTDVALRQSGAGVLHATDPQRPWTSRATRSIVTVYDLIPLRERQMYDSWRFDNRLLYRWYLRQVRSAARIIAISRTTAVDLQDRLGITAERIDVVYPVVTAPEASDRTEPAEPTFIVVGALDLHKQPELALRALAHFRERYRCGRLRFIGPSDPMRARRLHGLAARLGVAGSISIDGRIPDSELEDAYASATALLSVSRIEGFGLPPVEAVLRGVPVIAVETPAALETLQDVATIVQSNEDVIAEAMAHPTLPSAMAVRAIRERYSAVAVARVLAETYRRALA